MNATMKDIARETGLGLATISKYLNGGNVRDANRAAIDAAIKKLDYHINEYARGLKSNHSRTIGIVIPELSNVFVTEIITHLEEPLRAKGYSAIICDCHNSPKLECEAVAFLLRKRVDGIINMPVCQDGRHLKAAGEAGLPIVLLDRTIPGKPELADCVVIDNENATRQATRYLLERGHRAIGILLGPDEIYTSIHRYNGYADALRDFGTAVAPSLVAHSDYTVKGGHESFLQLMQNNPSMTALLVTNYEMTLGAILAANECSVQIPQRLSFIGFDNALLAKVTQPQLTIVTQPLEEIGRQAARIMLERMRGEGGGARVTVSLSASLACGASVAALPG